MGAAELVRKYLESDARTELLAEMSKMADELLMDAEVDVLCGAGYGERSETRMNSRNGHGDRRWDTRAGTITLEVPKLRRGSYFPGLLKPRRRAEQALVSVVAQAYVEGVSIRRVDDLVKAMGIEGMSKAQVSELAKSLDAKVFGPRAELPTTFALARGRDLMTVRLTMSPRAAATHRCTHAGDRSGQTPP